MDIDINKILEQGINLAMLYVPKVILAIVVLIVGLFVIKSIVKFARKAMNKSSLDEALSKFLSSILGAVLKVALIISIAQMVGVETTSFIAVLGAIGLAIGMALQGTLGNFAGSTLLMLFKPYKVGDYVEIQGHAGTVEEIQIFNTQLKTPDNIVILVPNGAVANGSIKNYSAKPTRRVDFVFGIGYDDDIDKAKGLLKDIIAADERIMDDPAPFIAVKELADSSVNFVVRVWSKSSDYWGIYFDMQEKVKKVFDREGVSIPYPQRDIHVHNVDNE